MWVQLPWGAMRLSTAMTALVVLLLLTWRSRSPWPGLLAVAAWLSAYEIVWNATDIAVHRWGWAPFWWWLTLSGWIALAWTRGVRPNPLLLAGFAVVWLAWLAAGFPYNLPDGPWSWTAEAWNLATKTLLAAAFVVGDRWPAAAWSWSRPLRN